MHVSLSAPVPFNRLFVCVGVGLALVELSITQCCWLLELISSSLFMSSFYELLWLSYYIANCLMCFVHLLIFCSLFFASPFSIYPLFSFSFVVVHIILSPSHIRFSFSSISFNPSLWIVGRVWLWFRNQSQASWFHVVSHVCSQCLICHIHIFLQGKTEMITRMFENVGHSRSCQILSPMLSTLKYFHQ